jgi:hypothetical protein
MRGGERENGVQVRRFPNQLCTDKGRAINQQEPGWDNTLTGVPISFSLAVAETRRNAGGSLRRGL